MAQLHFETKRRCIETIAPRDDWFVIIGHKFVNLNYLKSEDVWNRRILENSHVCTGKLIFREPQEVERSLYEIIEEDPMRCYNCIERESVKTHILIPNMALYLSAKSIEIICGKIFSKRDINMEFVKLFYESFFSIYLKRVYSWSSLHMLIKASKAYPEYFKITVKVLLLDTHISNNILLDYVETLDEKRCTDLMKFVSQIQLTAEEFDHNLPVIYLMYLKCEKNDDTFQYVQSHLELYSQHCAYNKNYGRLLLCLIQNISGSNVSIRKIKKMIEDHCTAFKSPCKGAIEKLVMEILTLHVNFPEGPRFVIPRPSEDFQL